MDDDIPLWLQIGAIGGFTLYAMLLSGADVAFSSISKATLQQLKTEHEGGQTSRVTKWLDDQEHLFGTVVIGKMVMLVGAVVSATTATFTSSYALGIGIFPPLVIQSVLAIGLLLLAVECLPRVGAKRYPESAIRFSTWTVLITSWLLWPLITPLLKLTGRTDGFFNSGRNPYWLDDELHRVLELEESHTLDQDDKEMISSIIELHDTSVREVMVPRVDIVCADNETSIQDLLALIEDMGHSRIPIYQGSIDNIVGVIYAKDLLKYEEKPEEIVSIASLARPPYFVPETKKVDDLLREFQHEKTHLAIVVDEHGGIAGLVTLEDLLEEIVGEIQDEYDAEQPMYEELPDGTILVDAKLNIDSVNEILETEIASEGFETIGGLVYNLIDRVPETGEVLTYRNLRLVVRDVEGQRISKVAITKITPVPESEGR